MSPVTSLVSLWEYIPRVIVHGQQLILLLVSLCRAIPNLLITDPLFMSSQSMRHLLVLIYGFRYLQ